MIAVRIIPLQLQHLIQTALKRLKIVFSRKMSLLNLLRATRNLPLTPLKYNIPCLLKFSSGNLTNADAKKRLISLLSTGEKISISAFPKIKYDKIRLYDTVIEDRDRENQNKIDGACEGTLACSTCTLHFSQKDYDRLGLSEIDDEEQDLLDKGVDVRDTGTPSD